MHGCSVRLKCAWFASAFTSHLWSTMRGPVFLGRDGLENAKLENHS
jgi:hypothetical protein